MNHCVKCTLCLKGAQIVSLRPLVVVVQQEEALCYLCMQGLEVFELPLCLGCLFPLRNWSYCEQEPELHQMFPFETGVNALR